MDAKSASVPIRNSEALKVTTPSDREVAFTRVLNAPRELVFRAWTEPELLKRWLYGPEDWPFTRCEVDLKVGGKLRFEWRHVSGQVMGMSGVYREIARPERLVFTEIFDDDWTGGETLCTLTFVEHAGKTTCTQNVLYSSHAARDGALQTAMADGMGQSFDRLEKILA